MARPFVFENIISTPKDITQYVTEVDSCKFQGTGKIRSLSLMLNANKGAFITNEDYLGTGNTPIINQFDKFKITWTDKNSVSKSMIVEVDSELGQKTTKGRLLPIEFKGREAALQRKKFTAFYQFKTPKEVLVDLVLRYNSDKGTDDPQLVTSAGGTDYIETVPDNITNIYDFTKEISYYDAIMQVIRRLNQPIGQGGVGDFFSLVFIDREELEAFEGIVMHVFVQGAGTAANLQDDVDNPFLSLTYQIQSQTGNQVFVRGQQGTGYVPTQFHEFISYVEEISNYPSYNNSITYPTGIFTRGSDNVIYKAITDVPVSTPPPNASFWLVQTPADIIPFINYSHWTRDKDVVTKNSCSNRTSAYLTGGFNAPAFPDGNMVIREGFNSDDGSYTFWRDFALIRTNDSDELLNLLNSDYFEFATGSVGLYNGTRVLVDTELGAVANDFVGNDKFGRAYADSLAMYNGSEWIVIRNPQLGDQVVVHNEGRTYEWNVPFTEMNHFANAHSHNGQGKRRGPVGSEKWRDVSETAGGNDVFHHPKNIEKAPGLFPKEINGDQYISFTSESAIKITYEFALTNVIDNFLQKFTSFFDNTFDKLVDLFDGGDDGFAAIFEPTPEELECTQDTSYYDFGWWYALPFPYPLAKTNGIIEGVGELYGNAPGLNQKRDFAVLDLQNANYTHSGLPGLNNAEVEDVGSPFTGIRFYFLFDILLNGASKPFAGNIPFTVTMYDDLSQVWRSEFTYRFLGDAQEIELNFSEFTVDKPSRTPWGIKTLFQNIITPEIEIRSIFEPKRVRWITIQLNDSYDDHLRYLPVTLENLIATAYGLGTVTFEGTIDGLTLMKQPFTSSGVINDRVINPETVQMPNTRNLRQLRSVATALKDLHGLQFEEYTLVQRGDCSLDTEQSVNLIDPVMIKNSPRKLVLMTEDLAWHQSGEKAGFTTTRTLTRRLNA